MFAFLLSLALSAAGSERLLLLGQPETEVEVKGQSSIALCEYAVV